MSMLKSAKSVLLLLKVTLGQNSSYWNVKEFAISISKKLTIIALDNLQILDLLHKWQI